MLKTVAALIAGAGLAMTVACSNTDAGITTAVKSRMAADDTVKAYQINVTTNSGVVTLEGTVENAAAKEQAVTITRQTDGVRDVVDQITINAATAGVNDLDNDLRAGADRGIDATQEAAGNAADAAGNAADRAGDAAGRAADATGDAARNAANRTGEIAKDAGGVIADAAITTAVKSKMLADPMVKGLKIDVDTRDGVVTLNGSVASGAERDRATTLARDTNGAKRVVSNLKVGG